MKKNRLSLLTTLLLFAILTPAAPGFAQDTSPVSEEDSQNPGSLIKGGSGSFKNKKIHVDMTDELVQGSAPKPEVEYIFSKSHFNFKKMIKLRENFIPEAEKTKVEFNGR